MSALITRTFALLSDPCSLAFRQAHRSRRVAKGRCYNKRDPVNGGDIQEQAVGVGTQQNTFDTPLHPIRYWHSSHEYLGAISGRQLHVEREYFYLDCVTDLPH